MASEIRANTIKNRVGLGTVSYTNTGIVVSGIVTANNFSGPFTGDLDVDGHTNLDNVSVAGIATFSGIIDAVNTPASIRVAQDIQHKGDANTKISFPANDEISLETSGHDRLYIKSDGKIGLGTVTPAVAIHHFSDGSNGNSLRLENREGYSLLTNDGGALHIDAGFHIFRNQAGSTEFLRIASDGVATFAATNINVNRNAGDAFIALQTSGTSNVSLYGGASSGFRVFTKPSGGSLTERFQIKSDGSTFLQTSNVNINRGTSGAGYPLTVRGPSSGYVLRLERANAGQWHFGFDGNTNFQVSSDTTNVLQINTDGRVTVGDGNNLAADYVATMLIDGGDHSKLTIYSATNGTGSVTFSDGSGSGATRRAGFIDFTHGADDVTNAFGIGLADVNKVFIRNAGSNRGQLEVYGNFNESTVPAIEINDSGDARKVFLTNSSGDFNVLTRNGSQTKGQLKMFESGILLHNMKDPDSTILLQTFRAQTYRNQTGSTNPSVSPDQTVIIKGGGGTYDCFQEGNMTLTVNGGGNDHYQPVAFVPRGYDLDTSSFGGQWAGEMWIHQTSSQNPENYGYSGYNNWATMSFKCKWDCAHWNAKPNGFWVEHYINTGRGNIGKIDNSSTMSQFVIYLLPGFYHIRYNCIRGMAVHRSSSNGGSITLRDGGSMRTYSTLAYSSRNTSFDSEISPGSANQAYAS